jgi:hypothetical protein
MERKLTTFDYIVQDVISNVDHWNKKVKSKKYIINNDDSFSLKEAKIYRYLNTNAPFRLNEKKPNIISGRELY